MVRTRGARVRMWRLRRNPLRRRSDVVDAWILLAAWLIALAVGLITGLAAGSAVDHQLDRQRAERRTVPAVLTANAPGRTSASAVDDGRVWATVRWTAPDGSTHTGRTTVHPGAKAGTPVTVWIDRQGRLTSEPLAPVDAAFQVTWTGVLVALTTGGAVLGVTQLVRLRLERRRLERWDEEWARVDSPKGWKTG
ncbi:hypothetical protein ACFZDK_13635 [Streptomyces sp. NPDC007901]|uniref:Rv1733c family protein n=1 Tax=Streptomyces sp. NPDC007901 TaxID=3364785 RepID=UPI0036E0DD28